MEWRLASEEERATLKRVVALLLALAGVAELAAGRSRAVRQLVLWILLPAEAAARSLVSVVSAPIPFRHAGASHTDAMRLARRFRNLARALDRHMASALADAGNDEPAWAGPCLTSRTAAVTSPIGWLAFMAQVPDSPCFVRFPDTS